MPIGEESILIAVSSPHRQAAWSAGEEMLEDVKEKVEVWKKEEFEDGGVWRANRDGPAGVELEETRNIEDQEKEAEIRNNENEKPAVNERDDSKVDSMLPHPMWEKGPRPKPLAERGHGPVVHPNRPGRHTGS